jgi:hypothetical protein
MGLKFSVTLFVLSTHRAPRPFLLGSADTVEVATDADCSILEELMCLSAFDNRR